MACNLATEFRADRPSGAGHHNRSAMKKRFQSGRVEFDRIAPQQVFDLHVSYSTDLNLASTTS